LIITCPKCNLSKNVGDVRIPAAGTLAQCQQCQHQFTIFPAHAATTADHLFNACPSCNAPVAAPPHNDCCSQCGLVFTKYLARSTQLTNQVEPFTEPSPAVTTVPENSAMPALLTSKLFWVGILLVVVIGWAKLGHDWKMDHNYLLQPGNWQGSMQFRGKQFPFLLVIQSADNGKLEGYMDWVGTMPRYKLAIRGSYVGNHLLFEDYKFLEGEGQYGLHDNQDVYIIDNEMSGSAKNGNATLHAVKVATEPDPMRELQKQ
jgi:hypothetical protein